MTNPFIVSAAVLLGATCVLASTASVSAQPQPSSASAGRGFTETWCSGCHPVELRAARAGKIAPDFITIANRPTTSARSLGAYLESDHPLMPNFRLTQDEAADVIAYILSLKDPNHR